MFLNKRQLRIKIAESLLYMAHQRDPYIIEHCRNVATIAVNVAKAYRNEYGQKLSNEQIHKIKLSALLHDIGKILLPSDILNKPGKLNPLEFSTIKKHAKLSFEILNRYG